MTDARFPTHYGKSIDYEAVSKVYDQVRAGDPEMVGHLLEGASLDDRSLVLDVGCGTANNTILVTKATSSKVIGIDISAGMLEKAHAKAGNLGLAQATADHLPLRPSVFDFVLMTEVIHHLPDVSAALGESLRVLKKGGACCIATQSHRQIENRMTSRFFPSSATVDKMRYPEIDIIVKEMRHVGFVKVSSKSYAFTPVVLGREYLKTVEMRGYSMLHKVSEQEYQEGLKSLRSAFERGEQLTYSAGYTFVRGCKRK